MFWQRPTFIAKFQSLPRQISQFRGHFENRLGKNEKNRIASNKCDICTLDIMIDFHWKNEASRWRSEVCHTCSCVDILLNSNRITLFLQVIETMGKESALWTPSRFSTVLSEEQCYSEWLTDTQDYTSSMQRLWECVRRRNFKTDTLNDSLSGFQPLSIA